MSLTKISLWKPTDFTVGEQVHDTFGITVTVIKINRKTVTVQYPKPNVPGKPNLIGYRESVNPSKIFKIKN